MKKIIINGIDEEIFYEKLENGLDVYLYVNKNLHNNYVTFNTKYGSIYNEFKIDKSNKYVKFPNGIAHFLEHKVFAEDGKIQPEEFYAKSGAVCNAYTTFKNTSYLFTGPNNLIENTNYLLDFVQNIYLTDENVESEKGIIIEEIKMCDDDPIDVIQDHIRKNMIINNPFKDSIIGTAKEVKSITKEQLLNCYNKFYNPNNMFLVITGNFNVSEMLDAIKDNQSKKNFDINNEISLKKYDEPDKVLLDYEMIKFNTNIPKVSYSFKFNINKFKMEKRKLNIYLFIIFDLLFGVSSKFDEELKKEKIIANSVSYSSLDIDSHFIISLVALTDKYEELIKKIDNKLKKIVINEDDFNRKKKVLISNEIFIYENIEYVNDMIVDNVLYDNKIEDNILEFIKNLSFEEMNNVISRLNFSNKGIIILKKDEKHN